MAQDAAGWAGLPARHCLRGGDTAPGLRPQDPSLGLCPEQPYGWLSAPLNLISPSSTWAPGSTSRDSRTDVHRGPSPAQTAAQRSNQVQVSPGLPAHKAVPPCWADEDAEAHSVQSAQGQGGSEPGHPHPGYSSPHHTHGETEASKGEDWTARVLGTLSCRPLSCSRIRHGLSWGSKAFLQVGKQAQRAPTSPRSRLGTKAP